MEYIITAYTDAGIRKNSNQDSLCIRRAAVSDGGEILLAVICDGMGGLQKGELASAECVRTFGTWFDCNLARLPSLCQNGFFEVRKQWQEMLLTLHQTFLAYASSRRIQLGTTVAAILTFENRCLIVNVGDSRIYERGGILKQLTQDHSLVAAEIAKGRITEDEARHHPQRNVLLQCLGQVKLFPPVFEEQVLRGGALYLLCTDGLVHELSATEIAETLEPLYLDTKEKLTNSLIHLTKTCKSRGETDNITSILFKSVESQYRSDKTTLASLIKRLHPSKKGPLETSTVTLLETAQIEHTQEVIA